MKTLILALGLMLPLALGGCIATTTYQGDLSPVSPKPHGVRFYDAVDVDSLQPTFKWKARDLTRPVDIAIWQAVFLGNDSPAKVFGRPVAGHTANYERGALVYLKEGIQGEEHRITTSLAPNTMYFWSLKHSGGETWSTATHRVDSAGAGMRQTEVARGEYFAIQTPASK